MLLLLQVEVRELFRWRENEFQIFTSRTVNFAMNGHFWFGV